MSTNVVLLNVVREIRKIEKGDPAYHALVLSMDKLELLEEMMRFQEARAQIAQLTVPMMVKGQILFKALEACAETDELRALTRSYRRHLKLELEAHFKRQPLAVENA